MVALAVPAARAHRGIGFPALALSGLVSHPGILPGPFRLADIDLDAGAFGIDLAGQAVLDRGNLGRAAGRHEHAHGRAGQEQQGAAGAAAEPPFPELRPGAVAEVHDANQDRQRHGVLDGQGLQRLRRADHVVEQHDEGDGHEKSRDRNCAPTSNAGMPIHVLHAVSLWQVAACQRRSKFAPSSSRLAVRQNFALVRSAKRSDLAASGRC